ncbi:MAG: type II toxin-antitoxin system VapC family toxin [Actinomycetota bacterium]|nr:type II toxin-antitoxin system VapC family toxin [Actinomycetota bacterium]
MALLDTSVLLRFFIGLHDELGRRAGLIRDAWAGGTVELLLLDLSVYEFGNVLIRQQRLDEAAAVATVQQLFALGMPVLAVEVELGVRAVRTAGRTGLSVYDAAFLAAAEQLDVDLLTADTRLAHRAGSPRVVLLTQLEMTAEEGP